MWLTRWELVRHFSWRTWLFGYQNGGPGSHLFAFGPVGLELRRGDIHCSLCLGE